MKRLTSIYLASFFTVLLSCQDIEKIKAPKKLLSKSEMKALVYDMVLLDASVGVDRYKLQELDIDMLEFLSKKYNLDSNELKQNLYYYNMKHDDNLEIYESVKDSIEKLEKAYDSIAKVIIAQEEKREQEIADSISQLDTLSKSTKEKIKPKS